MFLKLSKDKIYCQTHYKKALGNPDIALPRKKRAVFIDGDFWHGYRFSSFKDRLPDFWKEKIENNIHRDKRNRTILRKQGWIILKIWEHDLEKNFETTITKIINFLQKQ